MLSYNITQTSGTGGFFSFVTDASEFDDWEQGSADVSSYSAVSCEVRSAGQPADFGPFRTCTLPAGGAGLTDNEATLPFYLVVQATAPNSRFYVNVDYSETDGTAQAASAATLALGITASAVMLLVSSIGR